MASLVMDRQPRRTMVSRWTASLRMEMMQEPVSWQQFDRLMY